MNSIIDSICPNLGNAQRKRILELGGGNPGAVKVLTAVAMSYTPEVSGAIFWKLSESDCNPAQIWVLYKDRMNERLDDFVKFCLDHRAGQILKVVIALEQ